GAVLASAVAELPAVVGAPGEHGTVGEQCEALAPAGGDGGHRGQALDARRGEAARVVLTGVLLDDPTGAGLRVGAVAELPVVVATPAPHRTVGQQREAVPTARGDLDGLLGQARD